MSIKEKIRRHLESGETITPLQALQEYGTMSLPYHVFALRREGYDIRTRIKTSFSGRRYAEYYMVSSNVMEPRPQLAAQ